MLVCSVSARPRGIEVTVDIAEAAEAIDGSTSGFVVFSTLVDDPASVADRVDAFLGDIMVEAASASDAFVAGFRSVASIAEATTASSAEGATITPAPTGAAWNPSDASGVTFSNANLTVTGTGVNTGARSTTGYSSGKYYAEFTVSTWTNTFTGVGLSITGASFAGAPAGTMLVLRSGNLVLNGSNTGSTLGLRASGNIIGMAVDFGANLIWFRVAPTGNWNGSGTANPATGVGGVSISALAGTKFSGAYTGASGEAITGNFGASAFSGSVPSGFTPWP